MTMTDTASAKTNAYDSPISRGVVAQLMLADSSAAAEFYTRAFGAEEVSRLTSSDGLNRVMHMNLRINGGTLMFTDAMPERGYPAVPVQATMLHLQLGEDIDAWWERAVAAGAEVVTPLQLMFWGDRYGQLKDPFGVTWSMGSAGKK